MGWVAQGHRGKRASKWSFLVQLKIHSEEGNKIKKENESKKKTWHRGHDISCCHAVELLPCEIFYQPTSK